MIAETLSGPSARRRALTAGAHVLLTTVGYWAAFVLAFDFELSGAWLQRFAETLPALVLIRLVLAYRLGIDRGFWAHVGIRDLFPLILAGGLGSILLPLLLLALRQLHGIPPAVFVLEGMLAISLHAGIRVLVRYIHERRNSAQLTDQGTSAFIIGAGETGEQLLRQILHDRRHDFHIAGLIDDDPLKQDRSLHGVRVVGPSDDLRRLAAIHRVQVALIAIPSVTVEQLRRLVDRCSEAGVAVKTLPPLKDLVTDDVTVSQVRDVQIGDLLGREPANLDLDAIAPDLAGRVVMVTGAGGSIGSELSRQIARFHPLRLVLIDRAESPLYYIHNQIARQHPEIQVIPTLASVTNADRMTKVFDAYRPDCVFHAAAYKHVPLLEANVIEGVWNNIIGTMRVAESAARVGADKFVLISTDKAVNATSILGVTKFVAERIVLELPALLAADTDYRVVRFGNVLGSDGSVLPLFQRQLAEGGPLTVTHPEVRRYFMTIPEATQLVLRAAALPEGSRRITLLEMGEQIRIIDLAEQLIRLAGLVPHQDVEIVFTGLRPGEKLHEELVSDSEEAVPTSVDKIRAVERNGTHPQFVHQLNKLMRVTKERHEAAIIRALTELAPDYNQPDPILTLHQVNGRPQPQRSRKTRRAPVQVVLGAAASPALRSGTHNGT